MKKLIFIISLILWQISFAQEEVEEFEVTSDGINGYVVKYYDSKSASELYTNVLNWAEYYIRKAESAKKSDIQDEYLQYHIYYPGTLKTNPSSNRGYDVRLDIEFRFKNGKLRYDIEVIDINDGWNTPFSLRGDFLEWSFYKNNGKVKRKMEHPIKELNWLMNSVVTDVSNFIENKGAINSDW